MIMMSKSKILSGVFTGLLPILLLASCGAQSVEEKLVKDLEAGRISYELVEKIGRQKVAAAVKMSGWTSPNKVDT
jgi:hypothetical protein